MLAAAFLEVMAELLAQYIKEQVDRGWTKWRVADDRGSLVGRAGFGTHRDERALAYAIRRDLWGRALATEIATALVVWHRARSADAPRLWAHAAVANPASARVLVKAGFVHHSQEMLHGELCDVFRLADSG